jgi:hypothetical protein
MSDTVKLEAINNSYPASRQGRYWAAPMIEPVQIICDRRCLPEA